MKISSKILSTVLVIAILATSSFAGTKEKAIAKATEAVENGSPDDWKLLASQADYLIKKNTALGTAKEWAEKSISIKADAFNFEVMGDYYVKSNLPKEAIGYYIKSMDMVKVGNPAANTQYLQDKIISTKGQM
ncbi:MAG: hypothetical protein JXR07_16270 [Reichenbachiella sp.]